MKAVILDMYGVILKDTGDGFLPFVKQTFPDISPEEIYGPWNKADVGELSSLEIFEKIGFRGDLARIEREYLDTVEINEGFYKFAFKIHYGWRIIISDNHIFCIF